MTDILIRETEERFGIKADLDGIEKLKDYILDSYGRDDRETINKVFSSGEAAGFLTVNETYFFREPAHYSFLLDLLPSFEKTGIRICSAAVSTGCEAYSIAMLIEAYNRSGAKPLAYHIDGFDLNPKAIQTAEEGVYSPRVLRDDGSCYRFMADSYLKTTENGYRIDPSLKKNITFFVHNLMNELPRTEYDIIFFRNAFIYFLPQNRNLIIANLSASLREGGILFLGVSETAGVHHADLADKNQNDVFYFQKNKNIIRDFSPEYYTGAILKQNAV